MRFSFSSFLSKEASMNKYAVFVSSSCCLVVLWLIVSLPIRAKDSLLQPPKASAPPATPANGPNAPWLNLGDILDLSALDPGAPVLEQILTESQAVPTAVAVGDFDEDGVADLENAYSTSTGGAVALRRGNLEAIWPARAEAL